jgi:hypothetical protein
LLTCPPGPSPAPSPKAQRVAWCRAGDLTTTMDGPGMDFELCMSIVRNLLAIEAVR